MLENDEIRNKIVFKETDLNHQCDFSVIFLILVQTSTVDS